MIRRLEFWDRVSTSLGKVIQWLAIGVMAFSALLVCTEVFTRYVLGFSQAGVQLGALYLIICFMFLLAGPMVKTDEHISFGFVYDRLWGWRLRVAQLIITLTGVVVTAFTAGSSLRMTLVLKQWGQTTDFPGYRTWWIYCFMTAGLALMAFYYLEKLSRWIASITRGKSGGR